MRPTDSSRPAAMWPSCLSPRPGAQAPHLPYRWDPPPAAGLSLAGRCPAVPGRLHRRPRASSPARALPHPQRTALRRAEARSSTARGPGALSSGRAAGDTGMCCCRICRWGPAPCFLAPLAPAPLLSPRQLTCGPQASMPMTSPCPVAPPPRQLTCSPTILSVHGEPTPCSTPHPPAAHLQPHNPQCPWPAHAPQPRRPPRRRCRFRLHRPPRLPPPASGQLPRLPGP